jgi:ribosomal protein S3
MRQKISPEIFRLEKFNNNWKSKYTENKREEMSAFFFKSLEIKNFVKRFSRLHGLAFHNCKSALSNTSLNLFISYYTTKHFTILINRKHTKNSVKNKDIIRINITRQRVSDTIKALIKAYCKCFKTNHSLKKKRKIFNKQIRKFKKKMRFKYLKKKRIRKKKMSFKYLKKKRIRKKKTYFTYSYKYRFFRRQYYHSIRLIKKKKKTKRLRSTYIKRINESLNLNTYKNRKNIKTNSFAEHFIENITNYIGKKYSIFVTLKHLKVKSLKNFYLEKNARFIKEKFNLKLYKYKRSEFFEATKRIIFIALKKKNSAEFLANFVSSQLNRLKKQQYFFLKCIKAILQLLLKNTIKSTKLWGIKIIVKGCLGKARRANRRTFKLSIGKISLQKINSNINHAKATSYTSNGTFGTEVWINYLKT